MDKIDSVMFDLDGTLWDTRQILADAWTKIINRHGIDVRLTVENLSPLFGNELSYVIRHSVPNSVPQAKIDEIIPELTLAQVWSVRETVPYFYPGIQETFETLSKKVPIIIISNSVVGYIDTFLNSSGTAVYVLDHVCNGDTNLNKAENIKLMKKKHSLHNSLYVGDTQMDCDASRAAGVRFAFASYGFGNTNDFDYCISKLTDLISVVEI